MNPLTKNRFDLISITCIPVYLVVIFAGWGLVAGFLLPPLSPSAGPAEVAEIFQEDTTRIRLGMVLVMFAALIFIPFVAVVAKHLSRLEDGPGILTYGFLLGGVGNMVLTFYPAIMWLAVAYRPERDPEILHMINDMAWLQFIGGVSMFLAMPIVLVIAGMVDSRPVPVFPRWLAYATGWSAACLVCDQLLFFFHDGPFAWNGLIGLWIPVICFGAFFLFAYVVLRAEILREREAIIAGQVPTTASGETERPL